MIRINDETWLQCEKLPASKYKYMYIKGKQKRTIGINPIQPSDLTISSEVGNRIIELMKKEYVIIIDNHIELTLNLAHYPHILHEKFDEIKASLQEDTDNKKNTNVDNNKGMNKTRNTFAYTKFKKAVKDRDGKCLCCGYTEDLEVHHILPYSTYEDLRVNINNAVTLCHDCHEKYEKLYKGEINTQTLLEFIQNRTSLDKLMEEN